MGEVICLEARRKEKEYWKIMLRQPDIVRWMKAGFTFSPIYRIQVRRGFEEEVKDAEISRKRSPESHQERESQGKA